MSHTTYDNVQLSEDVKLSDELGVAAFDEKLLCGTVTKFAIKKSQGAT